MDGENAWEYYPRNGCFFLSALYKRLATSQPGSDTFSECVERQRYRFKVCPELVAGSWVYGTFFNLDRGSDKNRAWDMLVEAKPYMTE